MLHETVVVPHAVRQFQRIIVMPNLKPPVRTVREAEAYRQRILDVSKGLNESFQPLMTMYLTDNTTSDEIRTGEYLIVFVSDTF